MELSIVPDWLKNNMKKVEDLQPIEDIDAFLAQIRKAKEPKQSKKFTQITRDGSGTRTLHVALPMVDKTRKEISPMDYQIATFDLGPSTKRQEFQKLKDY